MTAADQPPFVLMVRLFSLQPMRIVALTFTLVSPNLYAGAASGFNALCQKPLLARGNEPGWEITFSTEGVWRTVGVLGSKLTSHVSTFSYSMLFCYSGQVMEIIQ